MNSIQPNRLTIPFLITGMILFCLIPFQACEKENDECTGDTCQNDTNMVRKPNIYLYPDHNCQLSVMIDFPLGGDIVTSVPAYNTGWNVWVDTAGRINDTFEYLFYESIQPDVWQTDTGWVIKRNELNGFFEENLSAYGFSEHEISDFTSYWIPRLTAFNFYEIYPQMAERINSVIRLQISTPPDNTLRLFYVIRGTNSGKHIEEPVISQNGCRSGFFVAEWGVILK
jgi:hypothetical protein